MTSSGQPPAGSRAGSPARPPDLALLHLDAQGRVRHASAGAGELWQTTPDQLVGRPFPLLFTFEVVSESPEFIETQWEVIASHASEHPMLLQAQPLAVEHAPVDVQVRLEASAGEEAGTFARITPVPAATPAPGDAAAGAPSPFDLLAESSGLGFFDLDFRTGLARYSPNWKRLLGYGTNELEDTYQTWLRLLHPDDSGAAPDRVGRKPAAGERRSFAVEYRMKHRRGHWVWLDGLGVQVFGADGRLERAVGAQIDIAERKEMEEQALLADDRLARLSTEGPLAWFDVDLVAGTVATSPAWQELTGQADPSPPLGAFARTFGAADAPELAAVLREPDDGTAAAVRRISLQPATGLPRPVWLGLHRQYSRRGDIHRAIGFVLETGDAGAAPADGLLPAALDAVREAAILVDARATVVHLNRAARLLTGYTAEPSPTLKLADVFQLVTVQGNRRADDAVDLALARGDTARLVADHALVPQGAPPRPIVWSAAELRDTEGRIAGVVVVFRDPQEMSLTPEELIRANRFESLGQLAGGIAHDFNNLLTTILGGVSHAKVNRDAAYLEDAEAACMAAKALTRQLLAFAKGAPAGLLQVVRPAEIMRDALRVAAAGSSVPVHLELDDDAGPVEVDRGQMLQVFQNLIINAIQAMPEPAQGAIWLRCQEIELKADDLPPLAAGRYVQMEVEDHGSGISPENLDRIFEPFFTTKKNGTGLGLATVLSIVRKHGGQLGVDSTVGRGTTFSAFLPVTSRPLESHVRQAPSLRYGSGRILLMDDDAKISELTAGMLASLEYTCDLAKNGEEALALYRRYLNVNRPYDLVILDLTIIGGMGGEECFRQLRALDPDVRAIISSGYDNEEMVRRFLDLGFVGYLTKPYRVGDLGRIIKSVLGR